MTLTKLNPNDRVVTLPTGERVLYRDGSHRYWLVDADTDAKGKPKNRPLTSVSSLLKAVGDPSGRKQDSLMDWAARLATDGKSWRHERGAGADRGSAVHEAFESLSKGEDVELDALDPERRPYFQAVADFWLDALPEVLETELIVASVTHGYAGRFDLLCRFPGPRKLWVSRWDKRDKRAYRFKLTFPAGVYLVDLKTSKVIGEDYCLQLAAYALALRESGHELLPDKLLIVRVSDEGLYEVVESTRTAEDFERVVGMHRMLKVPGRTDFVEEAA